MEQFKHTMLIAAAGLVYIFATGIANAGIFDSIKDKLNTGKETVTGHIDDVKSRFDKEERTILGKSTIIKSGTIDKDAVGQDFIHNSEGEITIEELNGKFYLVLGVDFDSSLGPDYHVYISEEIALKDERHFNEAEQIELGKLQYGNGYQYYEIPSNVDVTKIKSFLLWCKRFGAYIGSANLN